MIIFAGENTYESYHAAKKFVAESGAYQVVEADEISNLNKIIDLADSVDIFSKSQVLFVKRPFKNKLMSEQLANSQLVKNPNIIIWQDGKLDSRTTWFKKLSELVEIKTFNLPSSFDLPGKVMQLGVKNGVKVDMTAARKLIEWIGTDLWQLDLELGKLANYLSFHTEKKLSAELIQQVTTQSAQSVIWELLDNLEKSKDRALKVLQKLISQQTDTFYILSMLQRELRLISSVKYSEETGEKLALAPFVLGKAKAKARLYSWERITAAYNSLIQADKISKSGNIDPKYCLTKFILNL